MRIFLSYASEDADLAKRLASELDRVSGITVSWDQSLLLPGQEVHDRLRRAIEGCDFFVFIATASSIAKGYPLHELTEAVRTTNRSERIIPVVSGVAPDRLPPELGNRTPVDMANSSAAAKIISRTAPFRRRERLRTFALLGFVAAVIALGVVSVREALEPRAPGEGERSLVEQGIPVWLVDPDAIGTAKTSALAGHPISPTSDEREPESMTVMVLRSYHPELFDLLRGMGAVSVGPIFATWRSEDEVLFAVHLEGAKPGIDDDTFGRLSIAASASTRLVADEEVRTFENMAGRTMAFVHLDTNLPTSAFGTVLVVGGVDMIEDMLHRRLDIVVHDELAKGVEEQLARTLAPGMNDHWASFSLSRDDCSWLDDVCPRRVTVWAEMPSLRELDAAERGGFQTFMKIRAQVKLAFADEDGATEALTEVRGLLDRAMNPKDWECSRVAEDIAMQMGPLMLASATAMLNVVEITQSGAELTIAADLGELRTLDLPDADLLERSTLVNSWISRCAERRASRPLRPAPPELRAKIMSYAMGEEGAPGQQELLDEIEFISNPSRMLVSIVAEIYSNRQAMSRMTHFWMRSAMVPEQLIDWIDNGLPELVGNFGLSLGSGDSKDTAMTMIFGSISFGMMRQGVWEEVIAHYDREGPSDMLPLVLQITACGDLPSVSAHVEGLGDFVDSNLREAGPMWTQLAQSLGSCCALMPSLGLERVSNGWLRYPESFREDIVDSMRLEMSIMPRADRDRIGAAAMNLPIGGLRTEVLRALADHR